MAAPGGRGVARPGRMGAMKALPFPVRIAAGLLAIALEQARDLPRAVIELPVTAVSQALQVPMRVHQKLSELAIKGDRLLGTLRPVEEQPTWAVSDEDEPPLRNGASPITELPPVSPPTPVPLDEPCVDVPEADAVSRICRRSCPRSRRCARRCGDRRVGGRGGRRRGDRNAGTRPRPTRSSRMCRRCARGCSRTDAVTDELAAGEVVAEATATRDSEADAVLGRAAEAEDVRRAVTDELAAEEVIAEATAQPVNPSEPPALSGYAEMSIAELRSKLAFLELDDLQALLAWEMAHGERPPFVTMLTNRITMVLEE